MLWLQEMKANFTNSPFRSFARKTGKSCRFSPRNEVLFLPSYLLMRLTKDNIHALFNEGSPNSPQRVYLNIPYPLRKGWLDRLVGREIPDADYDHLKSLKGPKPKGTPVKEWRAGKVRQPSAPKDIEAEAWL